LPTAAAGSSQAPTAAVDKAAYRLPTDIAFGAPVTHPALRAAWIAGQRSTLIAGTSGTIRTSLRASRGCPASRWNAARDHDGTLPAIGWNGCPRSVEYARQRSATRRWTIKIAWSVLV